MLHKTSPPASSAVKDASRDLAYRPDIDGLRALAVMSVVLYHAFPATFPGGFIGVDIFFVISGYLISSIIISELRHGEFSILEFYCKRVRRIFPSLLTVLAASMIFGLFFLLPDELANLGKNVVGAALFISNIILWNETGYFDFSSVYKPLLHLWSLGVEEQFYLLWPAIIAVAWRNGAWRGYKSLYGISALILASLAVEFYLTLTAPEAAFYLPHSRFWELLCGALLAFLPREHNVPPVSGTVREIIASSSVLLIILFVFVVKDTVTFPGFIAWLPVGLTVALIYVGNKSFVIRAAFSNKVTVGIGRISYPLYLWHWPILSFLTIILAKNPNFHARLYAVLASILLAYATYRFIEKPIRSSQHLRRSAARLTGTMILVGLIGGGVFAGGGLPWRPMSTDAVNRGAFTWENGRNSNAACIAATAPDVFPFCMMTARYSPSVILLGDSHANALYPFFEAYFQRQERGVIMVGKAGCPPFLNVEKNDFACPEIMLNAMKFIEGHPGIKDVYLIARFAETESGDNYFEQSSVENNLTLTTHKNIQDRRQIFKTGLEDTLRYLKGTNRHVRIVLSIPELNFDPKTCLQARGGRECTIDKALVDRRQAAYRKIVEEVSTSFNVELIDPLDSLCSGNICKAEIDGKILYRDFHHLGLFGNDFLLESGFKVN